MGGIKQFQDTHGKNAFGKVPQGCDNSLKIVKKEISNQKYRTELNFYVILICQLKLVS